MELKLFVPDPSFKETYLSGFAELETDSDQSAWVYLGDSAPRDTPAKDFGAFVKTLVAREHNAPAGFVTDSVYWAISNGEMVGRISIRHELNDFLKSVGGHIGYIVRPAFRRKGVATEMLRQLLRTPKAQAIGKLLLTCDEGNIASEKSIFKNGGVFESLVEVGSGKPRKKHFWISLE